MQIGPSKHTWDVKCSTCFFLEFTFIFYLVDNQPWCPLHRATMMIFFLFFSWHLANFLYLVLLFPKWNWNIFELRWAPKKRLSNSKMCPCSCPWVSLSEALSFQEWSVFYHIYWSGLCYIRVFVVEIPTTLLTLLTVLHDWEDCRSKKSSWTRSASIARFPFMSWFGPWLHKNQGFLVFPSNDFWSHSFSFGIVFVVFYKASL